MRHTFLMAALVCSISGFAAAQTYEAVAPSFAQDASQRQAQNQWHAIGNVHLADGKTVPAYAVSVNNPVDDGLLQDNAACSRKSCDLNVAVSAAQSGQLQALRISGIGWVLAPRAWKNIEAAVGVNGSQSLLLKSPDGRESITYYNSGACVGCAYSAAAPFFPAALKLAQENEFGYDEPNAAAIRIVRPQANQALFSYTLKGQFTTHGKAVFDTDTDIPYQNLRVTLKPAHKDLATVILNAGVS